MAYCKDCGNKMSYTEASAGQFGSSLRCKSCGSYNVME